MADDPVVSAPTEGMPEGLLAPGQVLGDRYQIRSQLGYLIPSIGDTPEIESIAVPSYEPRGPYGAKEVGEGSMVPVPGSIANAIYDAVGVRMTELPITPQKILEALEEKESSGDS